MTKADLIHALYDFPMSTEIMLGAGDPLRLVQIDSWFPSPAEPGRSHYVLIANFPPEKELTFLCRTCRGSITEGTPNECPACKGKGRVTLENYHRW